MTAGEIIRAAVIAGAVMAAFSELGYRLGIVKANLLLIDGEFVLKRAAVRVGQTLVHSVGIAVHLVTSAAFGAVYYGVTVLLDAAPSNTVVLTIYVLLLWLAMLFIALPIAGQGLLGKRAASSAWYEQLALHAVFGVIFWAGLRLL